MERLCIYEQTLKALNGWRGLRLAVCVTRALYQCGAGENPCLGFIVDVLMVLEASIQITEIGCIEDMDGDAQIDHPPEH